MEVLFGLGAAYYLAKTVKHSSELSSQLNPKKAVQFDVTYIRDDDVDKELQSLDPDHGLEDAKWLGHGIGDYEYYALGGPDPNKEHEYFDPWTWKDKYRYTDYSVPHYNY